VRLLRRSATTVALAVVLAGCGGADSSQPQAGPSSPRPSSTPRSEPTSGPTSHHTRKPSPTPTSSQATAGVSKLLVFIVENHSLDEMRSEMPWTYALAKRYGYATAYRAMTHPSLPNYLAVAGGSTFGVSDDHDPSAHPLSGRSVFGTALNAGLTARVYADAMPSPCSLTSTGQYAVRHNPWTYFVDERSQCATLDTSLERFPDDVRSGDLPDAGMVVPDICHDAHNCSLAIADTWLRQEVGLAMSGPDFRAGRLAIVVTADEDDGSQGNTVLTVVVHPSIHDVVISSPLSQLSLSRLYTEVLGVAPLRDAAAASSMASAFDLPLTRG
jgi:phosphatidylinositol-3-phosphatase